MPTITITTTINAPIERVFDLARSIDAHMDSTAKSKEIAIAGVTSGLIGLNEEVTWQATHFGVKQSLKVKITAFDRPTLFVDEMIFGAFKSMKHTHRFESIADQTRMIDELAFEAPMWVLGRIAEKLFLTRYMHRFLQERNNVLKSIAESDQWKSFLGTENACD
ncbi:cell division protein [bacterium]|nr:MAG: cell division protein [bacterium]